MKKLLAIALIALIVSCKSTKQEATTTSASSPDTKLLAFVLKPKFGMQDEFESKLKAFAQTNFTGENDFRVQRVYGGVNDGSYLMTNSKLTSWAYYDDTTRDNSAFWKAFNSSVLPTLSSMQMEFLTYRPDLSGMQQGTYAVKNTVTERLVKEDKLSDFEAVMKKLKPVWDEIGYNVAMYRYSTGNTSRFVSVRRHPGGWGEKDAANALKDAFIKKYSAPEWDKLAKDLGACVVSTQVQFHVYRKDLSNK